MPCWYVVSTTSTLRPCPTAVTTLSPFGNPNWTFPRRGVLEDIGVIRVVFEVDLQPVLLEVTTVIGDVERRVVGNRRAAGFDGHGGQGVALRVAKPDSANTRSPTTMAKTIAASGERLLALRMGALL